VVIGVGLATERSQIRVPAIPLHVTSNGKLFSLPSSINWYRRTLGAKRALYATHWPRVYRLAASAGVWLRATEKKTEISATLRAVMVREGR